jgi:two-component system, chemotaxis family, chemotaxis protein CheY
MRIMIILVVDDEFVIRETLSRGLRRFGHQVLLAADGQEALGCLQDSPDPVDLVITDYNMPNMNGLTLIKRIREDRKHLPIFLITAQADMNLRREAFRLKCESFMEKPFSLEEIMLEISRVESLKH